MNMLVSIVEVADVVRGVTYGRDSAQSMPMEGHLPILRAGNIGDALNVDGDLVWVPAELVSQKQILRPNDLVMCTSSGSAEVVGKTAVFDRIDWVGSFGAFCAVIRPDESKCIPAFLKHVLKSKAFLTWARSSLGANIKNIRKSELEQFQFELPPLPQQERVAAILEKADGLRRKRLAAAHLADDLLRATFFEMFGDPVTNDRRWPELPVSMLATVTTGNTPSREEAAYYGNAIEWIKSDNINTPSHLLTTAREGLSERGASIGRTAPAGSTLMTCIAGSASCIGNVALSDRTVAFNQQINALTPRPGVAPEFLYALLLYSKPRIQAASTKSMKGMVSKGALERVALVSPDRQKQAKFSLAFRQVERLKLRMQNTDAGVLVNALQNKFFQPTNSGAEL